MPSSDAGAVHIIGAGVAGLAAAVRLSGAARAVHIHEATGQAGGRCRSYFDQQTGMLIDNGTHLLLSGNRAALSYAQTIGSAAGLQGPAEAEFPFIDLADKARWALRLGGGRFPWWVFDKDRRVPQTTAVDYLPLVRLAWSSGDRPIGNIIDCGAPLYKRLLDPLLRAALNIAPDLGSSKLARAVLRETITLGGQYCRPLLARDGLSPVFVDPAVDYLRARGVTITFQDELVSLRFESGRVAQLEFAQQTIPLEENDAVILAVPPYVAANLLPDLRAPSAFRGIVNAHFRIEPPPELPPMLGVINGTAEWIFALPDRISVTISDAGPWFETPRPQLAEIIWRDVAVVTGLTQTLPPWAIVRERRATFAATPEQNALRPGTETAWCNMFLAGDWIATGLPATLESAVRSGERAAELAGSRFRAAA
jgi:squalene-associated FAD-dependent desaturase